MLNQVKRKLLLLPVTALALGMAISCGPSAADKAAVDKAAVDKAAADKAAADKAAADKAAEVKADPNSIYARLGGQAAIDAAVDLFYVKVLADKSVNHHFEGINMAKQKARQKQFLTKAFGGPDNYKGRDLRRAHRHLDLKESDFGAIAGHLQATLKELKIDDALIAEVMAVAASTKDAVLNKEKPE